MSHCAPVARKPVCLEFTPEAAVGDIIVACPGRLFQTRGPATAKLLSPNVLYVRGTTHDLSVDERR